MCTSNAYSLTSVMHRVSSEWSRWEMSADDVLFSTRCHNYLAEKICYQFKNRKKLFFLYKSLEIIACLFYIKCVHTGKLRWILNCIKVNDCLMNKKKTNVMNYVKTKLIWGFPLIFWRQFRVYPNFIVTKIIYSSTLETK